MRKSAKVMSYGALLALVANGAAAASVKPGLKPMARASASANVSGIAASVAAAVNSSSTAIGTSSSDYAVFNIPYTGKIFKQASVIVTAGQGYNLSQFIKDNTGISTQAGMNISDCGFHLRYTQYDGGGYNKAPVLSRAEHSAPDEAVYEGGQLDGKERTWLVGMDVTGTAQTGMISFSQNAGKVCNKHNFIMIEAGSIRDKMIFYIEDVKTTAGGNTACNTTSVPAQAAALVKAKTACGGMPANVTTVNMANASKMMQECKAAVAYL
ncbi:MAG: hypothetical protein LBQ49_01850 [Rickettsiales bacterium]|jgi:hypothetical protein|nr:hypothetical protein [Rickettsiales bacterium]